MKKILFLSLILSSCVASPESNTQKVENKNVKKKISYDDTPRGVSVLTIDDCEYVYVETSHGNALIHKHNCALCDMRGCKTAH